MTDQKKAPQQPKQADSEEMEQLKQLLETYGRPVAAVLIGVLLVISVSNVITNNRTKKEQAAAAALSSARSEADLESVVLDYGKTAVAPHALLTLAKAHFDNDRFEVASAKYEEFLVKYADRPEALAARFGLLACQEATGDDASIAAAEVGYRAFVAANPASYLATQAQLGEARCLIHAEKLDDARVIYEDLLEAKPDSMWVPLVADQLESLKGKIARVAGVAMPTPDYTPAPSAGLNFPGMPSMPSMPPVVIPSPVAPVPAPVAEPVPAPVAEPVPAPVAEPVPAPVAEPVPLPVAPASPADPADPASAP